MKKPTVGAKEKLTSILISKDVLLKLLAPDDCAYLRLYFGVSPKATAHPDYEKNSLIPTCYVDTDITLVAVGSNAQGEFLKSDMEGVTKEIFITILTERLLSQQKTLPFNIY